MNEKVESLKGKLIVSCQALPHEPLHSSFIMGRMALAAKEGGAYGIRANTKEDIAEIQARVDLPVIGIVKRDYEDSKVYITPTMKEINELMEVKPDIIALDATHSLRPGGRTLDEFYREIRKSYPEQLLMADCSTVEPFTQTSWDLTLSGPHWWAIRTRAETLKLNPTILKSSARLWQR